MTIKPIKAFAVLCALVLTLTSCTPIETPQAENPTPVTTAAVTTEPVVADDKVVSEQEYDIDKNEFYSSYQLEKGVYTGTLSTEALDFEGDGFVILEPEQAVILKIEIPYSQHYKIGASFYSTDAAVALSVNNEQQDTFYTNENSDFQLFSCDGIYLEKGANVITLIALRGSVKADYLTVENSPLVHADYAVSGSPITANASLKTIGTMKYLASIYGNQTLTAQYCTPNTSAETDMLFSETGLYPAIRCGDLMYYSHTYEGDKEKNNEIELAREWSERGGIVSFSWHWYAPSDIAHYYTDRTGFKLDDAVYVKESLAEMDREEIDALHEIGTISDETWSIIRDIDEISEQLAVLRDSDIPVLWRPLMDGGGSWFWWNSCKSESYIWLWRLMFDRMSKYHGLNNLIWIWSGDYTEFYPGDEYVDIIGQDVYSTSQSANHSRFMNAYNVTINKKPIAMTECATVPNPDLLSRDGAMWLWFSVWSGDYIIDSTGKFTEKYTKWQSLYNTYHHENTVTLDELPDLKEFGLIDG